MNFTPKISDGPFVRWILTIAVVGCIGWVSHAVSARAPIVATRDTITVQQSFQTDDGISIVPAVQWVPATGLQAAGPPYYQPVSAWYKSKHWWKRNAPIVGGAGGGAVVGGLVGGGAGAIIGGAVGGGGGYLYKRSRHHHHHDRYRYRHHR